MSLEEAKQKRMRGRANRRQDQDHAARRQELEAAFLH